MIRTIYVMATALLILAGDATAAEYTIGDIGISSPWARATPRGAEVAGAYMTVTNKGTTADRLIAGSSPAAARLEFHAMSMEQGVMKMRPVQGGIELKPGATVEFKPAAFHIMLVGLKAPLKQGQHVKATLQFEKAGKLDIEYLVEAMGASGPAPAAHMDHMQHMDHK
jgi:copper(I)-binding protein